MTPEQVRERMERLAEALDSRGLLTWPDGNDARDWLRIPREAGSVECGLREEFDGSEVYVIQRRGMAWPQPLAPGNAGTEYVASAVLGWIGTPPPYEIDSVCPWVDPTDEDHP